MAPTYLYDTVMIGGGLAGLALAIQLAKAGKKVMLIEKEDYPFHKVCGEYISNESLPFLESLGLDFSGMDLPQMTHLQLSAPSGIAFKTRLDIGGTGLSRYVLDNDLYQLALASGVEVLTKTKALQVNFQDSLFTVSTAHRDVQARTVAGSYGKNSNIDQQLGRKYKAGNKHDLFIGVKYQIRTPEFDRSCVEIHSFPGGYCGFSAIEDDKINLSYICRAKHIKQHGSISSAEMQVLSINPHLKRYFDTAEFLFDKPLTISHLYFGIKGAIHEHILMLGDAAGNIAPLSGNGMSMALQSAKIAYQALLPYLDGKIALAEMEKRYQNEYHKAFSERIRLARCVHYMLINPLVCNNAFYMLKQFPGLVDFMSKKIHGKVF